MNLLEKWRYAVQAWAVEPSGGPAVSATVSPLATRDPNEQVCEPGRERALCDWLGRSPTAAGGFGSSRADTAK